METTVEDIQELIQLGRRAFANRHCDRPTTSTPKRFVWTADVVALLEEEGHKKSYANYLKMGDLLAQNPATFIPISNISKQLGVPEGNLVAAMQQLGQFLKKRDVAYNPHVKRWDYRADGQAGTETHYMFSAEQAQEWLKARPVV